MDMNAIDDEPEYRVFINQWGGGMQYVDFHNLDDATREALRMHKEDGMLEEVVICLISDDDDEEMDPTLIIMSAYVGEEPYWHGQCNIQQSTGEAA